MRNEDIETQKRYPRENPCVVDIPRKWYMADQLREHSIERRHLRRVERLPRVDVESEEQREIDNQDK
jgi:hypothetical protein